MTRRRATHQRVDLWPAFIIGSFLGSAVFAAWLTIGMLASVLR